MLPAIFMFAWARAYADAYLEVVYFGYQDADGELWLLAFHDALKALS